MFESAKLMLINCRLQALEEMFLRMFPDKKEELSALVTKLITETKADAEEAFQLISRRWGER